MTASAARSTAARDEVALRIDELLAGLGRSAPAFVAVPANLVPAERATVAIDRIGAMLAGTDGDSVVAIGEHAVIPTGARAFSETADAVFEELRALACRQSPIAPIATFALPFDATRTGESGLGPGAFVVPRVGYVVRRGRGYVFAVGTRADSDTIRSSLRRLFAALSEPTRTIHSSIVAIDERDDVRFRSSVEEAVRAIVEGKLDKVVLARRLCARLGAPIDLPSLLATLGDRAPHTHRFALVNGESKFVGATPERLVSCREGRVVTEALAGTKRHGESDALFASTKDRAEQRWVRDAIAQALEPLVDSLVADREPKTRELRDVVHLATRFEGHLCGGATVLDVLEALHPTPAVCGVPRVTALAHIRAAEPFARGFYAAPFGWVDANGDADVVVALRCGLFRGENAELYAGAGIVAGSVPDLELDETDLKLRALLGALDGESE